MVPRRKDAAMRGVRTASLKEEFVSRMAQQRTNAALRGVPIKPAREVCVSHMAQRWRGNDAASRGVLTMFKREAFVGRMVQR